MKPKEHPMRGSQPWKANRSRALRSKLVSAETKLWSALRNRQLNGHKFVRQLAVGPFFADFACRERKLIVEVDGATHGTELEMANDAERSDALQTLGYRIVRVTNDDVTRNLVGVLNSILHELEKEA
jgi:very-short-patch-repair endonuclease